MPDGAVRMLDLVRLHAPIAGQIEAAVADVVASGTFILGPRCARFEDAWAAASGAAHAVGTGSGLAALTVALRAVGVGAGDEVIVPSNTFIATWLAVTAVGATPVPAEPHASTHLLEPMAAAVCIGPRTAAILPVHLYGAAVDVDGFEELARRHGLALVFDAAQAHGAAWQDEPLGGRGTATAWSFYPGKNLGAIGDAGAVTTDDAAVAARVRSLRDYGRTSHDEFAECGQNERLDEVQAAVLEVKLEHLPAWQAHRDRQAARYLVGLADTGLGLPVVPLGSVHAWHQFVIRARDRDGLRSALAAEGIETGIHYRIPPHLQRAYAGMGLGPYPVAERLAGELLSLPIAPHVGDADADRVVAALLRALRHDA